MMTAEERAVSARDKAKQSERRHKDIAVQRQHDLRALMENAGFRRYVRALMEDTNYHGAVMEETLGAHQFNAGRRVVVVLLLKDLTEAMGSNALLKLLETEASDERSS